MAVSVLVLTTGGGTPLSSKLPMSAGSPASEVFDVELAKELADSKAVSAGSAMAAEYASAVE